VSRAIIPAWRPDGGGVMADDIGTAGSIGRRRAWPGSRAIVGGLLVTVAAVGVFAAYTGADPRADHRYVVAATDLDVGRRLDAGDLALLAIDLPDAVAGRTFASLDDLQGAIVLAPLGSGELVQASAVLLDEPGSPGDVDRVAAHELSLAVERDRAANGDLRRGEWVDVLATYGSSDTATTLAVVRQATVRSVVEGATAIGSTGTLVLTLAVPSAGDVMALAHAARAGEVTIVRSTRADASAASPDRYRPSTVAP
jgi:hypothetical protein